MRDITGSSDAQINGSHDHDYSERVEGSVQKAVTDEC